MSSKHNITHQFDQAALDKLIENRLSFYRATEATGTKRGAVEYVSVDTPSQMLQAFAEKTAAGYTLHESYPVSAQTLNGIGMYSFYVTRPEHMQASDVSAITDEVTEAYNEQRRQAYEQHKTQIVQESLERERREQERKAQAAEDKARAKFETEALQALGEFV